MNKLYPFQRELVQEMLDSPSKHLYNASPMGLGKTIQALEFANRIDSKAILIICPASLRLNWLNECKIWWKGFNLEQTKVLLSKSKQINQSLPISKCNLFITSYNMLSGNGLLPSFIKSKRWDLMILDEAHYIKTTKSKRTKAVANIWKTSVERVVCLSGTPIKNNASELFVPFNLITRDYEGFSPEYKYLCSNYYVFANMFCKTKYNPFAKGQNLDYYGVKNEETLIDLKSSFVFRRNKAEVLPELPKVQAQKIQLSDSIKIDKTLEEEITNYIENIEDTGEGLKISPQKSEFFATVRRQIGEKKAASREAISFIEDALYNSENESIVVFFYHKTVRDILKKHLEGRGIQYVVHDGETSPSKKQKAVDAFQAGEAQIFLAQVDAAEGYTVTRANVCVFVEYSWTGAQINQAVDRINRIGQKADQILVYFLALDNYIDKKLLDIVVSKQRDFNKVFK